MSKPRSKWWGYIQWCIRDYPAKKAELDAVRSAHGSDGMPRSKEPSRTTENSALITLDGWRQNEYEAVRQAVEDTERQANGAAVLRMIDLVFWKQTHTLQGAAMQVKVAYDTAAKYHGDFIRLVAKKMGLLQNHT